MPDMWPDALLAISELVGGQGAILFTARADRARWLASPGFSEDMDDYFNGHHADNERTRRLMQSQHPGFLTDLDVFRPDEIEQQKVYQEFWFPRGYGWGVATVIPVPSGDTLIYHAERKRADRTCPAGTCRRAGPSAAAPRPCCAALSPARPAKRASHDKGARSAGASGGGSQWRRPIDRIERSFRTARARHRAGSVGTSDFGRRLG